MDRNDLVKQILGIFRDWHQRAVVARVAEQHIDLAPARNRLTDIFAGLSGIGNIGGDEGSLVGSEFLDGVRKLAGVEVHEHDLCALGQQRLDGSEPDAAGPAGHDAGFTFDQSQDFLPCWQL